MKFKGEVTRIPIWGDMIPGNTGESKKDIMQPNLSMSMEEIFGARGGIWDKSSEEITQMVSDDTLVWRDEIENGYAQETYSDEPFLVPYLVKGSDKCVISCPGGAYLSKSVEGEGEDIAAFLNEAGISCFVLWYRTYPYHQPLMYLDLQRAVRFVRYHAAEYGINPQKISTVGFSAGGNLNGVHAFCFGNKPVEYPGYVPDEIDQTDGQVNGLAMCYPAISLYHDKALACIAGVEVYNDPARRKEVSDRYDMTLNVKEGDGPVFLAACMDDDVLPPLNPLELAAAARRKGVDFELHMFPKGGHGFGGCVERPNPFMKPDYSSCSQWKELYITWLNRILK